MFIDIQSNNTEGGTLHIKYLNNIIEQNHQFIKRFIRPMMGFKAYHTAESTPAGIELCHMLRKGQYEKAETIPAF